MLSYFKFGPVVQEEISLKDCALFNPGDHFVLRGKLFVQFLKMTLWELFMLNYFRFGPVAQEMSFKEKVMDDEQLTTHSTNDSQPETSTTQQCNKPPEED